MTWNLEQDKAQTYKVTVAKVHILQERGSFAKGRLEVKEKLSSLLSSSILIWRLQAVLLLMHECFLDQICMITIWAVVCHISCKNSGIFGSYHQKRAEAMKNRHYKLKANVWRPGRLQKSSSFFFQPGSGYGLHQSSNQNRRIGGRVALVKHCIVESWGRTCTKEYNAGKSRVVKQYDDGHVFQCEKIDGWKFTCRMKF